MAALRLKKFTLSYHRQGRNLSFDSFNRIVPVLLKSSCTSLLSLQMDLIHALPFMCHGISLENLVYLRVDAGFPTEELAQPYMLTLLKAFNFTYMFPKLSRVRVFLSSSSIPRDRTMQFVHQARALRKDPVPDRAANIKHLSFSSTTNPENAPFLLFAEMFPNIEKLSFETYEKRKAVFGLIWKHWTELKELEVRASFGKFAWTKKGSPVATWTENLDSEFCGIFPEEVAELRQRDEEYLRAVNIVPVMPSITCIKKLQTFRMLCKENVRHSGENNPNFIFSRVTCLIAFARCPNLSVILETKSIEFAKGISLKKLHWDAHALMGFTSILYLLALTHMKPYAAVSLDDVMVKYDIHY